MHEGSPSLVKIFSPVPLSIPVFLPFEIYDSNVDMGDKEYMFNTLHGNAENFESRGYLSGFDASLDLYCYT